MSVDFQKSETRENLMRAFAGESQARNRYTFAAQQARSQQLPVIEMIFNYTANQERAHAKIFYDHLKQLAGTTIHVDGGYPVDIYTNMDDLLKAAQHNEYEEHDPVYKTFGDIAREEGFTRLAYLFEAVAAIEKEHEERYLKLLANLEGDLVFKTDDENTVWICRNCGHIHVGKDAPAVCPVCAHPQAYFERRKVNY